MLIKIGSLEYKPEFIEEESGDEEQVWRITDKLMVENGDKKQQLKSVDYGQRIYIGDDIKIFYSKPIQSAKIDLTSLTMHTETVNDVINKVQLATCKQVEYIGIPNTDAATALDEKYYRDMHVFTIFKSDLLSGACIGIQQFPTNPNGNQDEYLIKTFRICHFFILKPFQGMGIGRLLYSTVKSWVNENFNRLCVEDPNELFSNLRDHCDLAEFKQIGGLMALKKESAAAKKQKLDPTAFIGKYAAIKHHIKKLEELLHVSPVRFII